MPTSRKDSESETEAPDASSGYLAPYLASHAYSQLTDAVPLDHALSPFILSFRRDVVAPVYGILNQVSALRFFDQRADPEFVESMFESVRALERNAIRLLTYAKETAGPSSLAEEPLSLQSITHETALLSKAMFPLLFRKPAAVRTSGPDVISSFSRHRLTHFLSTLLYFSTSVIGSRDVQLRLSFSFDVDASSARWEIPFAASSVPWTSFEDILDDPKVLSRSGFEVNFIRHTTPLLGASLTLDPEKPLIVCQIPCRPIREVSPFSYTDRVVWTTSPIVMSSSLPDGFSPVSGNVVVLSEDTDPFVTVEKSGARVFLANHTKSMSPPEVNRLINICARMPIPVIFRSDALDYDVFHDAKDFADAVLLEPCRRETLARYVVGLSQSDRRARRRAAEIHS